MVVSLEKTECMHVDSELVQHFSRISVGEADYSDTSLCQNLGTCVPVLWLVRTKPAWAGDSHCSLVWGGTEEGA